MTAKIMAALAAALIALLAVPVAQAAPPDVQHFTFENELDPGLSAQFSASCGFPVEARVTGKISVITRTTNEGVTKIVQPQSYVVTYTNPATGESVTLRVPPNSPSRSPSSLARQRCGCCSGGSTS